jgi:transcription elongation factor Elf1
MVKRYRCPNCGRETTALEILDDVASGGQAACYCEYDTVDGETGDVIYSRILNDWVLID